MFRRLEGVARAHHSQAPVTAMLANKYRPDEAEKIYGLKKVNCAPIAKTNKREDNQRNC